jgi:hypothetical protein
VTSVVDVPEEVCDLNPTKLCRFTTRLVPSLTPDEQCTVVPKEGYYFLEDFLGFFEKSFSSSEGIYSI